MNYRLLAIVLIALVLMSCKASREKQQAQLQAAQSAYETAYNEGLAHVLSVTDSLASSTETADVIASAALAKCEADVDHTADLAFDKEKLSNHWAGSGTKNKAHDNTHDAYWRAAVARVVETRLGHRPQ